jgi:hypothetical protein
MSAQLGTILTTDVVLTSGDNALSAVLAAGNTTGANDLSVNSGQAVIFNNSTFTARLVEPTLAANAILTLPSITGTIALVTDIPAAQGLSSVLGVGNTTGANNIIVSASQEIQFTDNLNSIGLSGLEFHVTANRNFRVITPTGVTITDGNGVLTTQDTVSGALITLNPSGDNVTLNNGTASATLDFAGITVNRSLVLPDANGTLALVTDIPAAQGLSSVLGVGNTTGGTDLVVTNGDTINVNTTWEYGFNHVGGFGEVGIKRPTWTGFEYFVIGSNLVDDYFLYDGSQITLAIPAGAGGGNATLSGSQVRCQNSTGGFSINNNGLTGSRAFTLPDGNGKIVTEESITLAMAVAGGQESGANINMSINAKTVFLDTNFNGFLGIPTTSLTALRTWNLPDASGTIALTSDIPANIVTGTGNVNFNVRWTGSSTVGDGIIQDNGTSASIGVTPSPQDKFSVVGVSGTQAAIKGESSLNALINWGLRGIAGGGTIGAIAADLLANASGAGGISKGAAMSSLVGCGTVVHPDAQPFTSFGFTASAGNNTGNANHVLGGYICAIQAHANDNVGLYINTQNGGAGNSYAMLIEDGNEGAGKVLTSDADGFASWQTPSSESTFKLWRNGYSEGSARSFSQTYETVASIIWGGTTVLNTPTKIEMLLHNTAPSMDVRIYDVTNALVICELLASNNPTPTIRDLGALSNLSAGQAVWELQVLRNGGTGSNWSEIESFQVM